MIISSSSIFSNVFLNVVTQAIHRKQLFEYAPIIASKNAGTSYKVNVNCVRNRMTLQKSFDCHFHVSLEKPKVLFLLIEDACFCSSALCRFQPNFIVYESMLNSCNQFHSIASYHSLSMDCRTAITKFVPITSKYIGRAP